MWDNSTLFHWTKSIEKSTEKKNKHLQKLPTGKSKYWHNQLRKAICHNNFKLLKINNLNGMYFPAGAHDLLDLRD